MYEALGHEEEFHKGTEMTCETNGSTDGVYCTRCEQWLVEQEELIAHPESVRVVEGKDATCTEEGLTDGKYCDHCQAWVAEQETIEKIPHTESDWITDGVEEYKVCEVCGEETERRSVLGEVTDILEGVGINCSSSIAGVASVPAIVTLLGAGLLFNKKTGRKDDEE